MVENYIGKTKILLKYLGFLVDIYQMDFKFQSFSEYLGFWGPIDTYSFYNEYGCFTLFHIVQKGELGWYTSKKIGTDLLELLKEEIIQTKYTQKNTYFFRQHIKVLSDVIRKQIDSSQEFFGIRVNNSTGDGSLF